MREGAKTRRRAPDWPLVGQMKQGTRRKNPGKEGLQAVFPFPLPFLSFLYRKPTPTWLEKKLLLVCAASPEKRETLNLIGSHGLAVHPNQEFREDHIYGTKPMMKTHYRRLCRHRRGRPKIFNNKQVKKQTATLHKLRDQKQSPKAAAEHSPLKKRDDMSHPGHQCLTSWNT